MANVFSEKPSTDLICPFAGNMVMPVFEQKRIFDAAGGADKTITGMQAKLFPCQGEACVFWNKKAVACSIRLGFDALPRIERLLAEGEPR